MPGVLWNSEEERAREWEFAKKHLYINGKLKPNGTKISRKDKEFHNELTHSFMVIDNQIIALSGKGVYLGSGKYSRAKLSETEDRQLIALKITHNEKYADLSKKESIIANDIGLSGTITFPQVQKHPGKHYLAYQYLGVDLFDYLQEKTLSLDECYELCIKIALQLHELHSGSNSQSQTPYLHGDIHVGNIVINENNDPHFIDFNRAEKKQHSVAEDIVKLLLVFFRPIKDRNDNQRCWIFEDWLAEYEFLYYVANSKLQPLPKSVEETQKNSIYIYLDLADKNEAGFYSIVHYIVRDGNEYKRGVVNIDGLGLPKLAYQNDTISDGSWVDWRTMNDNQAAVLEHQVLKIASQNGDIKSKEQRSEVLFNLLKNPKNFYTEGCPTALDIALILTLCRLGLENYAVSGSEAERQELIYVLNAMSKPIFTLYEKLSVTNKENLQLVKSKLMELIHPTAKSQDIDFQFKEYLATLPASEAALVQTEINNVSTNINSAKLEFVEKSKQEKPVKKTDDPKQEPAINTDKKVENKEIIITLTSEEKASYDAIVKKLHTITKKYLSTLGSFKSKDADKKVKLEKVVNQLVAFLENDKESSPAKIEKFYGFLDSKTESVNNIDIIKTDTRKSALNFLAGIAIIVLSIATLPISIPVIALIYTKTGNHPLDFFKSSGDRLEKHINQIRSKALSLTFFSSKEELKENLDLKANDNLQIPYS